MNGLRQLMDPPVLDAPDHVLVFLDERGILDDREIASHRRGQEGKKEAPSCCADRQR
jgi:hypothetical protein